MQKHLLTLVAFILGASPIWAEAMPPNLADLRASQAYQHTSEWLKKHPSGFVATNVRGNGYEYAERRLAALDLVRQQRDFGVVSELMSSLERNGFLSAEIIDVLEEWKAKRAVPLMRRIAEDPAFDPAVRERAKKAAESIQAHKPEAPPQY